MIKEINHNLITKRMHPHHSQLLTKECSHRKILIQVLGSISKLSTKSCLKYKIRCITHSLQTLQDSVQLNLIPVSLQDQHGSKVQNLVFITKTTTGATHQTLRKRSKSILRKCTQILQLFQRQKHLVFQIRSLHKLHIQVKETTSSDQPLTTHK